MSHPLHGEPLPPARDDDVAALALDPAQVLPSKVAALAAAAPERPFLAEVTGRHASYGETWTGVRRWITWLRELGAGPGTRVVSMLPASVDAVALWLAAGCAGVLEVPVDPALRGVFLRHVLADSGARVCLVRPEQADLLANSGVGGLRIVVVGRDGCPADQMIPADEFRFPAPADPSCVIYTSGTTGLPKGVMISWAQMSALIGRIPRPWLSERDCVYLCHPMFHVTGRTPIVVMSDIGGLLVLRERFSASAFLDDVRAGRCTSTTAYIGLILATPERDDDADNPLRFVWSAGAHGLAARFAQRFGTHVLEAYGSTEVGFPLVSRTPPPDIHHRWIGSPRAGYAVRVVGPDGADVADGSVGELWVRPPAREMMLLEYLNQPEATAAATEGGWYRTGDAVIRHRNGTFIFVDRMKDTIRRHGENISSAAVEGVAAADPAVAECAVLGVPDRVAGQAVVLVVVPSRDGCEPAELYERLRDQLPRYALPGYIVLADAMPRTSTNKVRKVELRESMDLSGAWRPPGARAERASGPGSASLLPQRPWKSGGRRSRNAAMASAESAVLRTTAICEEIRSSAVRRSARADW
jgi:carnitine-CoA ligase